MAQPFTPPPAVTTAAVPAAAPVAAATTNTVTAFPPNLASILAQARSIAASVAATVPVVSSGEFSFKASSLKQYVLYLHTSIHPRFSHMFLRIRVYQKRHTSVQGLVMNEGSI